MSLIFFWDHILGCSYYAARSMADGAQLVFCPYNYIINPVIRGAMNVNIKGAIIVFDEAQYVTPLRLFTFLKLLNYVHCTIFLESFVNENFNNTSLSRGLVYLFAVIWKILVVMLAVWILKKKLCIVGFQTTKNFLVTINLFVSYLVALLLKRIEGRTRRTLWI